MIEDDAATQEELTGIAVVGMSGRFPQAADIGEFWRNLCAGRECLHRFDAEELRAVGIPQALVDDARYVPVNGLLADVELFDADFFRMNPREASVTDPQQRVFLELAWHALEHAGYDPTRYEGAIGVYAGCGLSSYLLHNLWPNRAELAHLGELRVRMANSQEYLATRVSYKLNLKGPSVSVNTACSTSLVAVHMACDALLNFQCDMALGGGVSIQLPQGKGYLHEEGGILSPDGHCRAFDAGAGGTVSGNGGGIVVLKRLGDALADGDTVYAVILGSAVNNDGSDKAGYTAPSVNGQARVIVEAQEVAGVEAESIACVEAHGTGTPLGDPIEFAALTRAFRRQTDRTQFCALGSVKTNVGHLDEAAGVAGLIKTVLSLHHRQLPPSLHFESPNPEIDYAASPFYVNAELCDWPATKVGAPRRAAVSSFGIGGTNAHVVVEEAPARTSVPWSRPIQLLPYSASNAVTLRRGGATLADWLTTYPEQDLADIAYTLQVGRRAFARRQFVLAADADEAVAALASADAGRAAPHDADPPPVVFMFSGQGSQHPGMSKELYEREPVFRRWLDACAELLLPLLGRDLRRLLYPADELDVRAAATALQQTELAQPALFAVEFALAQLWQHWGVRPRALIGHSLGEYVCACVAGVLELDAALALVVTRGRLMQSAPAGAMLAVPLSPAALKPYLDDGVEIAAINAPDRCVVAGPTASIQALAERLRADGSVGSLLNVSHAFHSAAMDSILEDFATELRRHELRTPRLPYVSNLTGEWITTDEARDHAYYLRHLREPVQFAAGLSRLLQEHPRAVLLEIGPGQALTNVARRCARADTLCLPSTPPARSGADAYRVALSALGKLWQCGVEVDWPAFAEAKRRRVALPVYQFERKRFWIEGRGELADDSRRQHESLRKNRDVSEWFYFPSWKRSALTEVCASRRASLSRRQSDGRVEGWLFFIDECGVGSELAAEFERQGRHVITVSAKQEYSRTGPCSYVVRPCEAADFRRLIGDLAREGILPANIVHLWSVTGRGRAALDADSLLDADSFGTVQAAGFYSLVFLAKALAAHETPDSLEVIVVTEGVQDVTGDETLNPFKATILGPAQVWQQELPAIRCRSVDIVVSAQSDPRRRTCVEQLSAELCADTNDRAVALRGRYRWTQVFEPLRSEPSPTPSPERLRHRGVYLIIGGLGGVGLQLAEYLAEFVQARLVLTGRSSFPGREEWDERLSARGDADAFSKKIRRLLDMEARGARVLALRADVADEEQMEAAVAEAERHFGPVNGVVHAAGVSAEKTFVALQELEKDDCEEQFRVKARGLIVLEKLFRKRRPDFYLLFSSLSTVLGGLGFAAYAAANHFLDAAARHNNREDGPPWLSVNFDGWLLEDEEAASSSSQSGAGGPAPGITAREGQEVFRRLFGSQVVGQVVVSTGDLQTRIEHWVEMASVKEKTPEIEAKAETFRDRPHLSEPYVAPRAEAERKVAEVWQELLGIGQIGVHDDFFELRGDSLLGTQLVASINRRFDAHLSLRDFFERPTIAEVSKRLNGHSGASEGRIPPAPSRADYPLTHAQKRLWILARNADASVAYNMCYSLTLGGAINYDALRNAFGFIVERHESLRTAFVTVSGEPRQQVRPAQTFQLPVLDLRSAGDAHAATVLELSAAVERELSAESLAPFRLDMPPLLRARLLRVAEDEHVLLVSLHHIVNDGLSLNVLMRELHAAYSAFCAGRVPELAPLAIQYKDFAVWQQEQLNGEGMRAHRAYWLEKLGGDLPALDLPLDRARPALQQFGGGQVLMRLSAGAQQSLRVRCHEQGVTMFMLLAATLKVLLHQLSGQADIIIGSPVAGREQAELEGQIGYYLNNVVLRDTVNRNEPFTTLLRRVRATVTEALAHQSYPFDRLIEELAVKPAQGRSPLFDVQLNLMPGETPSLQLGDLAVSGSATQSRTTIFDLNFMFSDGPSGLAVEIGYSSALFDAASVERLGEKLLRLLTVVAERPESTVRQLCNLLEQSRADADKAEFLAAALDLTEEF